MKFILELIRFLFVRKKYWLVLIVIVHSMFGGLIMSTQGKAIAPFVYKIF